MSSSSISPRLPVCSHVALTEMQHLHVSYMFHVTHRDQFCPESWVKLLMPSVDHKEMSIVKCSNWAGNFTKPCLLSGMASWPLSNPPLCSSCHCKRDVSGQPHGSAVPELEAKQWQLRMGRHLCSYKAFLLFLHLNIVVEKQAIQKIQHLFSDGKRLTVFAFPPFAANLFPSFISFLI